VRVFWFARPPVTSPAVFMADPGISC
jgi:hypothetical protein